MAGASATPERQALRESAAGFVRRHVLPHLAEWEEAGEVPREVHRAAADAGLLGIGFAEEVGGQGGDLVDVVTVLEAMVEAGASSGFLAALFTHSIALPHIVAAGDADLIDRFVRPTLAGELIGRSPSPSPTADPTSPRCAPAPSGTGTSTSSTAPRPSSPAAAVPTSSRRRCAPAAPAPAGSACSSSSAGCPGSP